MSNFSSHSDQALIHAMEEATLAAGSLLVQGIQNPNSIRSWRKGDQSVVTNLDLDSQRLLIEKLGKYLPLISEEDEASHSLIGSAQDYFLIDPLDGTSSCRRFLSMQGGQLGFGPLVGLVRGAKLIAASFYHLPQRTLYSAAAGQGAFAWQVNFEAISALEAPVPPASSERRRLKVESSHRISEAAILFYPGTRGEMKFIEYLRANSEIENTYRFGGFANDCTRLAIGYEQAQVQFAVKAWDYPAILFPMEAGLSVTLDPKGEARSPMKWIIQNNNPVLISVSQLHQEFLDFLSKTKDLV